MLQLKKNNTAPLAIITIDAEPIISVGAIISKIPMLDQLDKNPFEILKDGMKISLDADEGLIEF